MREQKASVVIFVSADGVYRVRLRGQSWADEPEATQIYQKIAHFVREIDRSLKIPAGNSEVVQ